MRVAISEGALISSVNLAEVLTKLEAAGKSPDRVARDLRDRGALGDGLLTVAFTEDDAIACARLRRLTAAAGLSLGDRACLALAGRLGLPALTADQAAKQVDVGVEVRLIRSR